MYNKIAPIILNLNKAVGAGLVYVSQPEVDLEKQAGKLFILADIDGKKADIIKLLNFLQTELETNYYQDDKIALLGKFEGLKLENIFEAALAKTNKSLTEFIKDHKIKFDPDNTNLSVGVIAGAKIHFSSFGKNRSLLIYRRHGGYEIINIDSEAQTATPTKVKPDKKTAINHLFSSIVSGEVPLGSYFIFASESVPEYLSGLELVRIVTKLPPLVAAEQIKNVLAKINNYVPFLGLIIKNTKEERDLELAEIADSPRSAQSSISSLNYTEQKTENLLAPAGFIKLGQLKNKVKTIFSPKSKPEIEIEEQIELSADKKSYIDTAAKKRLLNLPSSSSFLKPPKIFLKKSSSTLAHQLKKFIHFLPHLFTVSFWKNLSESISSWAKNLSRRSLFLLLFLVLLFAVFTYSLIKVNQAKQLSLAKQAFEQSYLEIEEKESLIDSYLLYENFDGAVNVLASIDELITNLEPKTTEQISEKDALESKLSSLQDKILGIERVKQLEPLANYQELELSGINLVADDLFAYTSTNIYQLDLSDSSSEKLNTTDYNIVSSKSFTNPANKTTIYYFSAGNLLQLDPATKQIQSQTLANYDSADNYQLFAIFNNNPYFIAKNKEQIHLYRANASASNWLKNEIDLNPVVDIYIDGSIYLLDSSARVARFYGGEVDNYSSQEPKPAITSANKLLGDNNQLYLLVDSNRLVVLDKESGKIKQQFIFSDLNVADFSLDASSKTVYLLANGEIYRYSL